MKHALKFLLLASIIATTWEAEAQIKDDDSSASLLALQCSMSSGRPPSNYDEYCRKLAKTVGLLAPAQQERVFGYLPQPAAFASGDINGYGAHDSASGDSSASGDNSASGDSTVNPLVAFVGDFNDSFGSEDPTGAIIGGQPPADSGSESESAANGDGNWWEGFLGWLGEKVENYIEENGDEIESYLEERGSGKQQDSNKGGKK